MRRLLLLAPMLLAACPTSSGPDELVWPAEIADTCDPIDPSVCALPFPSSHFLVAAGTSTGVRVAYGDTSLPLNRDGIQTQPTYWNERDGYSINSPMLAYLPDMTLDGVLRPDTLDGYDADDVKTVIIDTVTGERVPHWVEIDDTAPAEVQRLTLLRPAVPLEWGTRYVVGIRGVTNSAGEVIASSNAFQSLKDGGSVKNEVVAARQGHYEGFVFPALEAEGFSRDELVIAWDFVTASRDNTVGRMEWMREDALAWVEEQGGVPYTITKNEDHDCSVEGERIARDLEGTITVPNYLIDPDPEDPQNEGVEALLTRGDDGMPFRNGTRTTQWLMRIPCSVGDPEGGPTAASAPVVQYGHGLLGSHFEARTGYLADMSNRYGFINFAMPWDGFMEDDVSGITFMLAANDEKKVNQSHFAIVAERSMQGMVQKVLGMRMVWQQLVDDDALKFGEEGSEVSVLDPERRYYYGNSQGGIMGAAYLAFSPDIHRGVLGVGGGPYSLLLPRSKDFDPFFLIFQNKFADHREIMLFVAGLTQQLWDPVEPGGWMWDMTRDVDPPKEVLMQVAIYDHQVTTLAARIQARAYGAYVPSPGVRPVFGVPEQDVGEGMPGPAYVEWKYTDLPDEPDIVIPPGSEEGGAEGDPHECPRREPEAQAQLWTFLSTGLVEQTCPEGGCFSTVAETCP